MNRQRIKELAQGWFYGPGMPTPQEASEHFRLCALRDPLHAAEYGEALSTFLSDRDRLCNPGAYAPSESHVDATEFRERMKSYKRVGPAAIPEEPTD